MVTGQNYTIIKTTKENIVPFKALSIQVSLNGLSFCILNPDTNTIEFLKNHRSEKQLNPKEALDLLKETIDSEESLQQDFKDVLIIHDNELSSLVPSALFNEEHLADYLKFNTKILKTDYIAFDELKSIDSVNVYVPYVNINNHIYGSYGEFVYKHHSTVLIEHVLKLEKNTTSAKMYVNVTADHFEIVVVDKEGLKLYNTFEYGTKEDFIYYILFTAEQLGMNPETFELCFMGDINSKDELYDITYKYVRHVSYAKRADSFEFKEHVQPESHHGDFVLIHSFL